MGQVASRFTGLFIRPAANLRPNDDEDPEQQLTFANAAGEIFLDLIVFSVSASFCNFVILFNKHNLSSMLRILLWIAFSDVWWSF
ncbi:unnamed protein product [Strongylus vulgaris]|uniref:Uncharacterized protein n=1 Tax=Strongylus vulgaris TaxID=40348 RepID=A0A3P7LMF7_STRVU|nr:unnamed protein product [Strongylus vulgaris]